MQVSRSSYYEWRSCDKWPDTEEIMLKNKIQILFEGSRKTYGSRRLVKALKAEGYNLGRFKVRRLMEQLKLQVRYPKRFRVTTDSDHSLEVAPNRLNRQFNPTTPNEVWTTDISYVWTLEGWMYVAVVIDLYSRQVVGWAIDEHMKTSLCIKALQMAYWRKKPPKGLIHHSDRGSQYASHRYREELKRMEMIQSMSRRGNCWDNSPTERFFRSLKSEHLNYERFSSKEMAKLSILDYIAFYNGRRIHSTLGYKSPIAFEREFYCKTA
jgi:transposase InsO family protein